MKTSYKVFIAKIIHFFLTRLLKINTNQIVRRNNINYSLDLNEGIDLSIFLFGKFQDEIIKSIFRLTKNFKDKFIILDIGSNIGEKSLSLSQVFKTNNLDYFIHSIEPTDFAYKKQIKNLDLNKNISKKIKLHKLYLSDKIRPNSTYSSWNLLGDKTHKIHKGILKKINVKEGRSVDIILSKNKLDEQDF